MKLDSRNMRYLTPEDWRILTATEIGSKNHEVVPTVLISKIAGLRGGSGVERSISSLAKFGLIAKQRNNKYDGYRLTYGGLDYLALHTYQKRDDIYSVGNQIGVGKESDIIVVAPPLTDSAPSAAASRRDSATSKTTSTTSRPARSIRTCDTQYVLKVHRLGRISFRTVKANRDYLRNRTTSSWQYLSKLAAQKEYALLTALHGAGFPVPDPVSQTRHTLLMSFVDAYPLRQFTTVPDPAGLYGSLIELIIRLAQHGLIHGDFNEFNILMLERPEGTKGEWIGEEEPPEEVEYPLTPILIDFPQAVSIDHVDAERYFDRDVTCIKTFFERKFSFIPTTSGPFLNDIRKTIAKAGFPRLDVHVQASGFSKKKQATDLDTHLESLRNGRQGENRKEDEEDEGDEDGEGSDGSDEEPSLEDANSAKDGSESSRQAKPPDEADALTPEAARSSLGPK